MYLYIFTDYTYEKHWIHEKLNILSEKFNYYINISLQYLNQSLLIFSFYFLFLHILQIHKKKKN